ncbi:uncharacterized protein LOC111714279 [Eurytemora carolleeae]|uniref:uncharacterized protein LOC111714279 n=1 Tax=Eurytemora carolleeae TaxID=1294199 RepID=UPI000C75F5AF|nr:uncharacterized protein LOC111714279 [Eurytemora carolleeae]|eukprot:XP_023345114.1 uncharacterized protein LOC111714279 [Eurytemora affinis]
MVICLELSRFMIITKCPLAFTYWDIHKQKFEGLWSTYYSTVVYRGEPITREPDSFFNQTFRVGYNDYSWCFWYDNFTSDHFRIDKETYEGYYLIPFIETHELQTIFINGNDTWGHIDEETGKWTGVVGMVGYGKADVGVSCIGYTYERQLVLLYFLQDFHWLVFLAVSIL